MFQVSNKDRGRLELTLSGDQVRRGEHKKQFANLLTSQMNQSGMDAVTFNRVSDGKRLNGKQALQTLIKDLDEVARHEQAHADTAGKHAVDKIHFGFKQDKATGLFQVTDGHVEIKQPKFDLNNLAQTAKNYMQVAKAAIAPKQLKGQIADEVATPSKADMAVHKQAWAMANKAAQLAKSQGQTLSIQG